MYVLILAAVISALLNPPLLNPALLNPNDPFWSERAPASYEAKFETSKGEFVIGVCRAWAPNGADRFYNLVRAGFFDDSRFFRVRAGYIAQFGIAGDPRIAAVWRNQTIPDDPVRQSNHRGWVAFAMTGPHARTTQIYINLADNTQLNAQGFAPIGKVIDGMENVEKLYAGYGENAGGGMRAGHQDHIFGGGNAYMDEHFPKLDKIIRAMIVEITREPSLCAPNGEKLP